MQTMFIFLLYEPMFFLLIVSPATFVNKYNVDSVECHASGQDRPLLVFLSVRAKYVPYSEMCSCMLLLLCWSQMYSL